MKKIEQLSLITVKKQIDNLVVEPSIRLGLKIVFLGLGANFLWLAWWWNKLPPEVPLLLSRAYGEGRLVNQWGLWILPFSSVIISLVSIRIASSIINNDKLLGQMLIWLAALIVVMGLISLIEITLLIT